MALELASRALDAEPVIADDGSVTLAGYRIPSEVPNTLTLNFEGGDSYNDIYRTLMYILMIVAPSCLLLKRPASGTKMDVSVD